jgi:hypothetical protein
VTKTQRGEHGLLEQIDSVHAVVLAAKLRRVLEAERNVQASICDRGNELVGAALCRAGVDRPAYASELRDGRGHQLSQGARKRADPEQPVLVGDRLSELRLGKLQPVEERLRVCVQELTLGRQREPAPPTFDQARAELDFQRPNLLRYRRLRERERAGGARERLVLRDCPEREDTPRIEHRFSLYQVKNDNVT